MKKHVALLKGGLSGEREVSLASAESVTKALKELGYKVTEIDAGFDVAQKLSVVNPDLVFNALHGTYGEDGCIQGVLELLRIPYTHSGVLASAMAMHKPTAKIMFQSVGIRCPEGYLVDYKKILENDPMPRPYVVKPVNEGSSLGVVIIRKNDNLRTAFDKIDLPEREEYLVERYIEGKELTIAVLDGKALGVLEIKPHEGFYDYSNKYTKGRTEYIVPAEIDKSAYDECMAMSEKAFKVLGCRGVARTDIRLSVEDRRPYMLEINTHPGFTQTSLTPKIAAYAGISFTQLIERLLATAKCENNPAKK